jgi:uncharacterized protein (TIGR00725 family)
MPEVITVFGSSRPNAGQTGYEEAFQLGAALAENGFVLCTGGYGGVMEAASRGAREAGGKTMAVTAEVFKTRVNPWVQEEIRVKTWEERLFGLIRRGGGYVVCAGGTGTLVELAVVWEMLNKRIIPVKPFVALGDFWRPVIERVREVETGIESPWGEADAEMIYFAADAQDAARHLREKLRGAQS